MFLRKIKKGCSFAAILVFMGILTGCGSGTENVSEGMVLIGNLDYQGALAEFDEAAALAENERLIARGRGIAYMGITDYEQAVNYFKEALAGSNGLIEPIDFDVNYYLAAAYTKNGQFVEAKEVYDAILALRSNEKDAYFLRGCVTLELADYESAKADFDKVVEMDKKNYDRLIEIYQVLEKYGYKEIGLAYLQAALDAGESQMKAYDKGRIYYYMGEYQKAYIALEEAREDGNADSFLYLGKAYEATGDYNYASSVYSSYLTNDSQNAAVYNQLGLCEMVKKDYRKALEAFQAGMQIEGNEIMQALSFNEIVAYEYLGEFEKAAVLLESYLKSYPDDEKARREYEFLVTR
uniref:tetratricopeptide repeat protein n=1 Tax=Acetatifactor sp. TaxID=1872090 RepID=UPI004056CCEF